MTIFRQICTPGSVVIEVGANIGAHTVGLARLVGPQGRVLAFEPQRLPFQNLCANVALNSLDNVDCFGRQLAAGTCSSTYRTSILGRNTILAGLHFSARRAAGGSPWSHARPVRHPAESEPGQDRCVEGMEADVLRGGEQLLKRFRPILYVENDRLEKSEALARLIASYDYRMYWHLPPLFNPDNFFANRENSYPNVVSANMLCGASRLANTHYARGSRRFPPASGASQPRRRTGALRVRPNARRASVPLGPPLGGTRNDDGRRNSMPHGLRSC